MGQPERVDCRATRTGDHHDARHVEPLVHEPTLRLALNRLTGCRWPLRDEDHFPPAPQHLRVQLSYRGRIGRLQRRPEVWGRANAVPNGAATTALLFAGSRVRTSV